MATSIFNTLFALRRDALNSKCKGRVAVLFETHADGMEFFSCIKQEGEFLKSGPIDPEPRLVYIGEKAFFQVEYVGIEIRWPARG